MNYRLALVFLDFSMFLVLAALAQFNNTSANATNALPDIVFVQKVVNLNSKRPRIDDVLDIGVQFKLNGATNTDKDHGDDVTIEKNSTGLLIMFHEGVRMPNDFTVFVRHFGDAVAGCIASNSCPSTSLTVYCSASNGPGDRQILSANNNYTSTCLVGS